MVCSGQGWVQESTWWCQLSSLDHSETSKSQLIQKHKQSQGNQCICQRSINAGCNCGTQLPAGRFLAYLTRWPENTYISSPENQASAENQELHHPAENCFIPGLFSGFVRGFFCLLRLAKVSYQQPGGDMLGVYTVKKGGREEKTQKKKENRNKDISGRDAVIVQCQHNGVLTII